MRYKNCTWLLAAVVVLVSWPAASSFAQSTTCNANQNTCSIETRTDNLVTHACNDNVDNDLNGMCDTGACPGALPADPHCLSEALCQDGIDNDSDGFIDTPANLETDCQCLDAASTANSCTAGDIGLSYGADPSVSDGCINGDDTVVATIDAQLIATVQRYDLGMWVLLEGADAFSGSRCARQMLQPRTGIGGPSFIGNGPYDQGEPGTPADVCGDVAPSSTVNYMFPFEIRMACSDLIPNQNGFVDIGQCGSWDNNQQDVCTQLGNITAGTPAKCFCSRADTGIPGPNVRTVCTNFNNPDLADTNGNGTLDPGESATFTLAYTNTVANCTPGLPTLSDPLGRLRCGTASFIRYTMNYSAAAAASGTFTYNDGDSDEPIPVCPLTAVVPANNGVLCNDTANLRLIWAPRDVNPSNTYGVISPFGPPPQNLPVKFTLNTFTNLPYTYSAQMFWDNNVDTDTSGAVSATEAVDMTGAILQNCTNCSCSAVTVSTTPVTLASFTATPSGREVRFDWSTATEVGNVGFDLYAKVEGERVRLNAEPIAATSSDSLEPQSYSASFKVPDGADSFEVVDLDIQGRERVHGPFVTGESYGRVLTTLPIDWATIRRENGVARDAAGQVLSRSSVPRRMAQPGAAMQIALSVDKTGLYRVTSEALLAAGFDLSRAATSQLGLNVRGHQVPIYVSGGGNFGPGSYLEFYGEALDSIYTKSNIYVLATGQSSPARAAISRDRPVGVSAASYREARNFERDLAYSLTAPSADPFYDTRMLIFTTPNAWNYAFDVDAISVAGAAATLKVDLFGGVDLPNLKPDHKVEVLVNGVSLGVSMFDGLSASRFEAPVPAGVLNSGANQLTLRLPGLPGAPYDLVYLDAFSVDYSRNFAAIDGRLDFSGSGARFEVNGLPGAAVSAYRRDASGLTRLERAEVVASGGSYRVILPGSAGSASYSVGSAGSLLAPSAIRAVHAATDLLTGPATYLVVSHSSFLDGLSDLVTARKAQGLSVKVVDVDDVYALYSGGAFDAQAIRDYVAAAAATLGTRYVLLVGGDTFDYQNHLGLGAVSFVPTLYAATGSVVKHAPADSLFGDIDRDGVQDLAVGRLPVRSTTELAGVIAKTLEYENNGYAGTVALSADYSDAQANVPFYQASEAFGNELPADWIYNEIFLDSMPLADARTDLFSSFNMGTALISYVGHSGFTSWGSPNRPVSEHLFTISDVANLTNSGSPAVVTQFGCWNTYFASPQTESLGNRLVLASDRGAAAVMGAATLTDDTHGNEFGVFLAQRLGVPGQTLGDAIRLAKQDLKASAGTARDLRDIYSGWTLLGDPALQLHP